MNEFLVIFMDAIDEALRISPLKLPPAQAEDLKERALHYTRTVLNDERTQGHDLNWIKDMMSASVSGFLCGYFASQMYRGSASLH